MYLKMSKRLLMETDKRLLWKLAWNFGYKGMRSVQRFKSRLRQGEYFPPFLYISVINSCNLRCQGCWVDVAAKQERIPVDRMNRMIREAVDAGNSFFGILGGEPFMHRELLDILESHPDCYFQVFTNGQFITDEIARRLRRMGNVTPLISVEGSEIVSEERRRGKDVYGKTMAGIENCLKNKLITGVCTSVCRTNIDDLVREEWVDRLIEMGVMYMWYHTYRPIGPEPNEQLALTPEQQRRIREFVVEMRTKKPIGIIDAYYDGEGKALCPAATGISHHISPWGDIEPCPIIQFATEKIDDERGLKETISSSSYLKDFRETAAGATRGCIVLDRPDLLKEVVDRHGAKDDTARKTAMRELEALESRPSQASLAEDIPERSWAYRFAKKHFYSDFGAYAEFDAKK
jgi:MoaA/NifB/PqqE/SkfB family radical SAM enzyme